MLGLAVFVVVVPGSDRTRLDRTSIEGLGSGGDQDGGVDVTAESADCQLGGGRAVEE